MSAAVWNAGASPIYTLTDLGAAPGTGGSTFAYGLSPNGRVSGQYNSNSLGQGGFSWNAGVNTYVSGTTVLSGINDSGQASAYNGVDPQYWDGTTLSHLPHPSANHCCNVQGINSTGDLVGATLNSSGQGQATLWSGGLHSFLPFVTGYTNSSAWAINDSGTTVGKMGDTIADRAAIWSGGVGQLLVVPLGINQTEGRAISSDGKVVGDGFDTGGNQFGYYWSGNTATQIGSDLRPRGVNASGLVVGYGTYAFLWDSGTLYNLNNLVSNGAGWNLLVAQAINDSGQIVGYGRFSNNLRAFLLTPQADPAAAPEPGTVALSAMGLALVALSRVRGR
ncbi:MAG: hypothetical protein U0Q16_38310 [Bryobacteraceae bacterium]